MTTQPQNRLCHATPSQYIFQLSLDNQLKETAKGIDRGRNPNQDNRNRKGLNAWRQRGRLSVTNRRDSDHHHPDSRDSDSRNPVISTDKTLTRNGKSKNGSKNKSTPSNSFQRCSLFALPVSQCLRHVSPADSNRQLRQFELKIAIEIHGMLMHTVCCRHVPERLCRIGYRKPPRSLTKIKKKEYLPCSRYSLFHKSHNAGDSLGTPVNP